MCTPLLAKVETSEVAKEIEEGVGLPWVGHLAVGHLYLDFKEWVLYTVMLLNIDIVAPFRSLCWEEGDRVWVWLKDADKSIVDSQLVLLKMVPE